MSYGVVIVLRCCGGIVLVGSVDGSVGLLFPRAENGSEHAIESADMKWEDIAEELNTKLHVLRLEDYTRLAEKFESGR